MWRYLIKILHSQLHHTLCTNMKESLICTLSCQEQEALKDSHHRSWHQQEHEVSTRHVLRHLAKCGTLGRILLWTRGTSEDLSFAESFAPATDLVIGQINACQPRQRLQGSGWQLAGHGIARHRQLLHPPIPVSKEKVHLSS